MTQGTAVKGHDVSTNTDHGYSVAMEKPTYSRQTKSSYRIIIVIYCGMTAHQQFNMDAFRSHSTCFLYDCGTPPGK